MKTTVFLVISIFFTTLTAAQEGTVTIEQDQKITELLNIYKSSFESSEYYRIQVGFGSYSKAQRIKAEVDQDFPNLPSKIDFDSPTYRVRIGKFSSKLEAERKFIEVREKYPNAMILKPKKSTK